MRKLTRLILLPIVFAAACGDDAPVAQSKRPTAPPPRATNPGPGGKGAKPSGLVLKPKVERMYRKDFTPADFQADPTGDVNRDPFFSYLVTPAARPGQAVPVEDECQDRKVAEKYAYNDLRLLGIVMRGTKNFSMFRDPSGVGQVAFQGDCLGKDKARIIEITPACVRIEIRGIAPPGSPAPRRTR